MILGMVTADGTITIIIQNALSSNLKRKGPCFTVPLCISHRVALLKADFYELNVPYPRNGGLVTEPYRKDKKVMSQYLHYLELGIGFENLIKP